MVTFWKKILFRKKKVETPRNSKNFKYIEKIFHTYTVWILHRSDKNCLSSTASRVEKCSFEKNAFRNLKSAYLLSQTFDKEGCIFENKIFLGTRIFATYFANTKKINFFKILHRCYPLTQKKRKSQIFIEFSVLSTVWRSIESLPNFILHILHYFHTILHILHFDSLTG